MTHSPQDSESRTRFVAGLICVGGAAALMRHDLTRTTEPPLYGALPWLGFLVGLGLLWSTTEPGARILTAIICLGIGGALLWQGGIRPKFATPLQESIPWLVLLLGLVLLNRAIPP